MSKPETPRSIAKPLKGYGSEIDTFAFTSNSRVLVVNDDEGITLWDLSDLEAPRLCAKIIGGPNWHGMALNPRENLIALSTSNGTALWDISNPNAPKFIGEPFGSMEDNPQNLVFSPNGETLVLSDGSRLHIWDITNPELPRLIGAIPKGGYSFVMAFSPDGRQLASISNGFTHVTILNERENLIIWDIDTELWEQAACMAANRNVTQTEWRQYFPNQPYRKTCETLPAGK